MVLLRRKLPMFSQEDIGRDLGLIVPKKYTTLLPFARTGKQPSAGWGTQVREKKYSLNNFFTKRKLSLNESFVPPSLIVHVKEWIKKQIKDDSDIIVCFNYGALYGGDGQGHVSILDSISRACVTLIDPGGNVLKYRSVSLKRLVEAMDVHGEKNRGGFWLIS